MTEPGPPSPSVEHIVEWLREHRDAFTETALRERLLSAGCSVADVDEAFRIVGPPPARSPFEGGNVPIPSAELPRAAPDGSLVSADPTNVGAYFLALLLLGLGVLMGPLFFVAFAVVLIGWLALRHTERRPIAKGFGYALLTVVLLPVVAMVGMFGICLVAGPNGHF